MKEIDFLHLKVIEDFGTDPHPDLLPVRVRIRGSGSLPKGHGSGTLDSWLRPGNYWLTKISLARLLASSSLMGSALGSQGVASSRQLPIYRIKETGNLI
jgi:hypothetical protein